MKKMKNQPQQINLDQLTVNKMAQKLGVALAQVSTLEAQLEVLYSKLDEVKKENDELKEKKSKKKGE